MKRIYLTSFVLLCLSVNAGAQWLDMRDPSAPRAADGKPNLSAPAPKHNLSGVWQVESSSRKELMSLFPPGIGLLPGGENGLGEDDPSKYFLNFFADYKFGQEPFTPEAGAAFQKALRSNAAPPTLCSPPGLPVADTLPSPFKVVQTPGLTLFLYESDTVFRQVFTDKRKLPANPQPSWLGYSVGRWDGDWLVIDTVGFNDQGPFDAMGHPHSDALRVTERFHRKTFGQMEAEITIDDSKNYTKPVTVKLNYRLLPDTDLIESFCTEGEKDLVHLSHK